jgi:beta-glucosidase
MNRLQRELPGKRFVIAELGYGGTDDDGRSIYLQEVYDRIHSSVEAGMDIAGVFIWTGMDNYEWLHGYDAPFGIFTAEREPKPSAHTVRRLIRRTTEVKLP